MSATASANVAVQPLEPRRLLSAFADAHYNDVAFDAAGRLHLAYFDAAAQNLKYALRDIDGSWSAAATVDAAGDVGHHASLQIDPNGRPGIAYFDATHSDLKYAHLGPDGWTIEAVDTPRRVGLYPSLAYDPDGQPHISYYHMRLEHQRR
jgi:hypothetical protein